MFVRLVAVQEVKSEKMRAEDLDPSVARPDLYLLPPLISPRGKTYHPLSTQISQSHEKAEAQHATSDQGCEMCIRFEIRGVHRSTRLCHHGKEVASDEPISGRRPGAIS